MRNSSESAPTDHLSETDQARLYWLRDAQSQLQQDSKFPLWKRQFNLYVDEFQMWRCGGRMSNSDLPLSAQTPILLDKNPPLTSLIVMDAHQRVMHNGVKEMLTELRSSYWLVRGRQFVRKVIHCCLMCRKLEGRPFQSVPSPPLPEYRVRQSQPFCYTGVDFAGLHMLCYQSCSPRFGAQFECSYLFSEVSNVSPLGEECLRRLCLTMPRLSSPPVRSSKVCSTNPR